VWRIRTVTAASCILVLAALWTWRASGGFTADDAWTACLGHGSCTSRFPTARNLYEGLALFDVLAGVLALVLARRGAMRSALGVAVAAVFVAVVAPITILLWAL
jgi:hypothetical protein